MRPWPLLVGLAGAYGLALLGDQMLYVFLPSHPDAAGIGVAALGVILSANRFVRLAANPLAGLLSDRQGRRLPFLVGMALAVASTAGYLAAQGFWLLLLARIVWGIAFALISVGGVAIVLDVAAAAERGRSVGTYQSLLQLTTLLGLVLSGVLTDALGYRRTLAIYVPLTTVGFVVALVALGRRGRGHGRSGARSDARAAQQGSEAAVTLAGSPLQAMRALGRRLLAPAYAAFVSHLTGSGVLMATLGVFVKEQIAPPADGRGLVMPVASVTGMLLASRRLAGMLVAPWAGALSDRLGDRRPVAAAGALAGLLGFCILAAGSGVVALVLGVALVALGEGILTPAVSAWTGDSAPPAMRGMVMGALATAGDLGGAVGPLVGYALAATAGLRWAYGLSAGCLLSVLGALALGRRPGANYS